MCEQENPRTEEEQPQTRYDNELNDIELSKIRDYDAASVHRLLRIETELLAEARAKEEAMMHTYQSYMQESQEKRLILDQEIAALNSFNEELQQQFHMQLLQHTQMAKEKETNEEMKTVLTQYYGTLDENFKNTFSEGQELEKKQEKLLENYHLKKQSLSEAAQNEDKKLSEVRNAFENARKKHENEINVKDKILMELTEDDAKCKNIIAQMRNKCEDTKNEVDNTNQKLNELLSQNAELHDSKNEIDLELEKLKAQQLEKEQEHQEFLNTVRNKLNNAKECLNDAKRQKLTLEDDLAKEFSITKEQEAVLSKSKDQFVNLSSANQSLKAAIEETETRSVKVCTELQSELEKIDSNLTTLKEISTGILSEKETIIYNLQHIQQHNNELEAKLSDTQNLEENLLKENEARVGELSALQERKMAVEKDLQTQNTSLLDEKEKYFKNDASYKSQLAELDQKLSDAHTENRTAKYEFDTKKEQLKNELSVYKSDTEKAYQENQQMNKSKLQQLEERLLSAKYKLAATKEKTDSKKNSAEEMFDKLFEDSVQQDLPAPRKRSSQN